MGRETNMMIKNTPEGNKIEWKIEGRDKQRRSKGKYGCKQCYHSTIVRIPETLMPLITNNEEYTYIYEYFDKVCILPEAPENYQSTKTKLLTTKRLPTATMEVPTKIFDTCTMDYATITYDPNKKDYATNRPGLITIDVGGENKRKWIKRDMDIENRQIIYKEHVQVTNVPEGIHLHKDLVRILNPEKLYIYYYEGEFYLTDIDPNVECIETCEENFREDLFDYGIIDNSHEFICLALCMDEQDPSNNLKPKILIKAIKPEKMKDKCNGNNIYGIEYN